MRWITREKVKVDRVACPWLIQKFIDPEAVFVFVPVGEVMTKAAGQNAIPFDVEGCELGDHGEDVSFNSILKKYGLNEEPLVLLGEIVRAADSHPGSPHSAGEGLRWIAHGFSALGLTDHEILQREFVVYDALYAECQKRVGMGKADGNELWDKFDASKRVPRIRRAPERGTRIGSLSGFSSKDFPTKTCGNRTGPLKETAARLSVIFHQKSAMESWQ